MWQKKRTVRLSPRLRVGVGRGYSKDLVIKIGGISGMTLIAVAIIWTGVSIFKTKKTTEPSPQVLGAVDTPKTSAPSKEEFIDYKVQNGDTLFNISQKLNLNISWTTLAQINNLKPPFALKPGQTIKIPNTK